jgi:hypothetical protein
MVRTLSYILLSLAVLAVPLTAGGNKNMEDKEENGETKMNGEMEYNGMETDTLKDMDTERDMDSGNGMKSDTGMEYENGEDLNGMGSENGIVEEEYGALSEDVEEAARRAFTEGQLEEYTGDIAQVQRSPSPEGPTMVLLETDNAEMESLTVHLAPVWFIDQEGIDLSEGKTVTVRGALAMAGTPDTESMEEGIGDLDEANPYSDESGMNGSEMGEPQEQDQGQTLPTETPELFASEITIEENTVRLRTEDGAPLWRLVSRK